MTGFYSITCYYVAWHICQVSYKHLFVVLKIVQGCFLVHNTHLTIIILIYVTGFTKTILIGTRNEIQFIADY